MRKGQTLWIEMSFSGGVIHKRANCVVSDEEGVNLLTDAVRGAATQDLLCSGLVRFEFIVSRLELPPLAIEDGQFPRRRLLVVEDGGDEAVDLQGFARYPRVVQNKLDDADRKAVPLAAAGLG